MDYPVSEGKHGPIYRIAEGIRVARNEIGKWEVNMKRGGQRKSKTIGEGEEGFKEAIEQAEKLAAQFGILKPPETEKTFWQVAQEWLTGNAGRWTPATIQRYTEVLIGFVRPSLGSVPLKQVDRARIRKLLIEVGQIRSAKSVELVHAVISGVFSEAIDMGYTLENPAHGLLKKLLPPKRKRNQTMPDPLSREDLGRLLGAARSHLPEPYPLILETLANSGMRLGECLAMQASLLDVRNRQYMVSQTFKNDRYGLPKTGKRLIDLPTPLVVRLEAHVRQLRRGAMAEGVPVDYLFPGVSQRLVQGAVKRACIVAKLRQRSPHDLRHTYATMLLMDHMSPVYVQKQLGHHSITMTVDIYGHWIPGEGRENLEKSLRCPEAAEHRIESFGGRSRARDQIG